MFSLLQRLVVRYVGVEYLLDNLNIPWGGSPLSNPYCRAKSKLSVFENGQFNGHFFFLDKTFSKKCKMLWGKSFGNFFDTQKNFFSGHFFKKNFKKNFEKLFALKKFSKFFLNCFSKKVSWKNVFFGNIFSKNFFQNFQNFSAHKKFVKMFLKFFEKTFSKKNKNNACLSG